MNRMVPGVLAAAGGIVGILVVGAIAVTGRESIPEPEAPFGGISEGQPDQSFTGPAGKSVSTEDASALPRAVSPVGMTGQEDGAATVSYAAIVDERKIVRSAVLRAQVSNVADAFAQVGRMAVAAGGFVADASFREDEKRQTATVTLRVPANRFDELLQQLRGVSTKIDSETAKANDVTGEYSDLGARLRALEAAEGQLLQLLAQARNVGEVLQVQDRLNTV